MLVVRWKEELRIAKGIVLHGHLPGFECMGMAMEPMWVVVGLLVGDAVHCIRGFPVLDALTSRWYGSEVHLRGSA